MRLTERKSVYGPNEGAAAAGAKRPAEVIDLDATTGHAQPRAKRVRPSSMELEMRRLA